MQNFEPSNISKDNPATEPQSPALLPRLELPFIALDGPETSCRENAISVTPLDDGFLVKLAVYDALSLPEMQDLLNSDRCCRNAWRQTTSQLFSAPDQKAELGFATGRPKRPIVFSVEFRGAELLPHHASVSAGREIEIITAGYDTVGNLLKSTERAEDDFSLSLRAGMRLTAALIHNRKQRGDIIFADISQGLLLQPDGSWELYKPGEIAGRVLVQEVTSALLCALSSFALKNRVPVVFRSCECSDPELRSRLSERLCEKKPLSYLEIDSLLVDSFGRRKRLQHRSICSTIPLPHSGMGNNTYMRASAPLRHFQDFVNLANLRAFACGEALPYSAELLESVASQVNERSSARIRRKGREKYTPIVESSLRVLSRQENPDPVLVKSLIAACRDCDILPLKAVSILMKMLSRSPDAALPLLASLIFTRQAETFPALNKAVKEKITENPALIDQLIDSARSGKLFTDKICCLSAGDRLESLWCAGKKIVIGQRDIRSEAPADLSTAQRELDRDLFCSFIGQKHSLPLPGSQEFSLAPNIATLLRQQSSSFHKALYSDSSRLKSGIWQVRLHFDSHNTQGRTSDSSLTGHGESWLEAAENAASLMLAL